MTTLLLKRADVHHRIDGTGVPVLFLHGAGGSLLSWFQQVPYFSQEFMCASLDQPGFGASRWRSSRTEFADVLDEYVAHFGWDRFAVVAHSLGGWAALGLALRRPGQTLALVLSSSWAGIQVPEALRALEAREPSLRAARSAWARQDPSAFMPGCWTVPTLCISGEEDIVVPPKAMEAVANAMAGAELVSFPRTGHAVFLERPKEFNDLVGRFLRKHLAGQQLSMQPAG